MADMTEQEKGIRFAMNKSIGGNTEQCPLTCGDAHHPLTIIDQKNQEIDQLQAKIARLTARGIEDMQFEINQLREDNKRLETKLVNEKQISAKMYSEIVHDRPEVAKDLYVQYVRSVIEKTNYEAKP